jgi:hypothetical protein
MTIEETPDALSLPVAVIGGGMVAALIGTFVFFPLIDRFVRDRFRLGRGQALSILIACALISGTVGCIITYSLLHDNPRFQPPENEGEATRFRPVSSELMPTARTRSLVPERHPRASVFAHRSHSVPFRGSTTLARHTHASEDHATHTDRSTHHSSSGGPRLSGSG